MHVHVYIIYIFINMEINLLIDIRSTITHVDTHAHTHTIYIYHDVYIYISYIEYQEGIVYQLSLLVSTGPLEVGYSHYPRHVRHRQPQHVSQPPGGRLAPLAPLAMELWRNAGARPGWGQWWELMGL